MAILALIHNINIYKEVDMKDRVLRFLTTTDFYNRIKVECSYRGKTMSDFMIDAIEIHLRDSKRERIKEEGSVRKKA